MLISALWYRDVQEIYRTTGIYPGNGKPGSVLVTVTSPATGENWSLGSENIGVEIPGASY